MKLKDVIEITIIVFAIIATILSILGLFYVVGLPS